MRTGDKIARVFFLMSLIAFVCSSVLIQNVQAANHPILYFFWGDGCPHCEDEKKFLQPLHQKYPELEMRWFETWKHPQFAAFADKMRQSYNITSSSVPMTFIGNWATTGFRTTETSGAEIEKQVIACLQNGCIDPVTKLIPHQIAVTVMEQAAANAPVDWEIYPASRVSLPQPQKIADHTPAPESTPAEEAISIPFVGDVTVSQVGLPLFTLVIAGLDGFNPCAMWVLSFLMTLVLHAKSRAKIFMIGGIFVAASGVIYFLFMAAWLNIFQLVGYIKVLRILVALAAIAMGLINCKDYFFFKQGISLTIPESAHPKLAKKIRQIIHTSAWPAAVLGTIVLAVTANFIELMCTMGFPMIYTRILIEQHISKAQSYLYLAAYNVIYVIPLAVIVGIFAWKMGGRKLTETEGRILKLVSGVLMLALGLILLLKPQLLMFG